MFVALNGNAPDLVLLLGRLDERSGQTLERLDAIDARLKAGDRRMAHIDRRIARLEERKRAIGQAETLIKRWAPVWGPAAALAATGQWRAAGEIILQAVSGAP
ncbi:MAG: hypothetical protein NW200_07415 [Hyphomonadaceae bacterium]|nr:hypothetical protein [Hyphomonadaceae bacterium]